MLRSQVTHLEEKGCCHREELNKHCTDIELLTDEYSVLESCSQFANQKIAILRRGMCHCQGRTTEFSPEREGAIDPLVEAPHSDSVLSYLTAPVTTSTTTSSSSIDTPVENVSPVPVPAPVPAPIEDAGVLNHSDQENMEEDAEAEDAADAMEEEELAR